MALFGRAVSLSARCLCPVVILLLVGVFLLLVFLKVVPFPPPPFR